MCTCLARIVSVVQDQKVHSGRNLLTYFTRAVASSVSRSTRGRREKRYTVHALNETEPLEHRELFGYGDELVRPLLPSFWSDKCQFAYAASERSTEIKTSWLCTSSPRVKGNGNHQRATGVTINRSESHKHTPLATVFGQIAKRSKEKHYSFCEICAQLN